MYLIRPGGNFLGRGIVGRGAPKRVKLARRANGFPSHRAEAFGRAAARRYIEGWLLSFDFHVEIAAPAEPARRGSREAGDALC